MHGRIAFAGPFDFELTLRLACAAPLAIAGREWRPAPDHWHGREYHRVVWWTGQPALLRIKNQGVVESPKLEWWLEGADAEGHPERIAERVRRMFSADVDLSACYASFRPDPVLSTLAQQFYGLRVLRFPSLFEGMANTILEQQLNFWFASQVKRRLIETFGPAVSYQGCTYHGYPSPSALMRLRPEDLRPLQISAPKARALIGLAQAACARTEALETGLSSILAVTGEGETALEAACEHLMQLRGVGRWSAEYVLLRGLGVTDALPAGDVGLQRSVRQLYRLRSPVTPLALRRRWRKLSPWRGYAAYYVWLTQWA